MPRLRKYSAKSIYKRVMHGCRDVWTLTRIKAYLEKQGETKVDALWLAKRKDIRRKDKLWILIRNSGASSAGLAPTAIRRKVREFAWSSENSRDNCQTWYTPLRRSSNSSKRAMRLLVKLLEEEK